jgi:hypothetical protein
MFQPISPNRSGFGGASPARSPTGVSHLGLQGPPVTRYPSPARPNELLGTDRRGFLEGNVAMQNAPPLSYSKHRGIGATPVLSTAPLLAHAASPMFSPILAGKGLGNGLSSSRPLAGNGSSFTTTTTLFDSATPPPNGSGLAGLGFARGASAQPPPSAAQSASPVYRSATTARYSDPYPMMQQQQAAAASTTTTRVMYEEVRGQRRPLHQELLSPGHSKAMVPVAASHSGGSQRRSATGPMIYGAAATGDDDEEEEEEEDEVQQQQRRQASMSQQSAQSHFSQAVATAAHWALPSVDEPPVLPDVYRRDYDDAEDASAAYHNSAGASAGDQAHQSKQATLAHFLSQPGVTTIQRLLAARGILPRTHPDLCAYHCAPAFVAALHQMMHGAYFVRFDRGTVPKERFYTVRLFEIEAGVERPYLCETQHQKGVQLLDTVPLEDLVGVTGTPTTWSGYNKFSDTPTDGTAGPTQPVSSPTAAAAAAIANELGPAYREQVLAPGVVRGSFVGQRRVNMSLDGALTFWFYDRKRRRPRELSLLTLNLNTATLWRRAMEGVVAVNSASAVAGTAAAVDEAQAMRQLLLTAQHALWAS